ncbi:hypothetical protein Agub_g7040, partial [Astrephomene gubernaculifera]
MGGLACIGMHSRYRYALLVLCIVSVSYASGRGLLGVADDSVRRDILFELYLSTGGPYWNPQPTRWGTSSQSCTWEGVTCCAPNLSTDSNSTYSLTYTAAGLTLPCSQEGQLMALELRGRNLSGLLPAAALSQLAPRVLDLADNPGLGGALTSELLLLEGLVQVDVRNTSLTCPTVTSPTSAGVNGTTTAYNGGNGTTAEPAVASEAVAAVVAAGSCQLPLSYIASPASLTYIATTGTATAANSAGAVYVFPPGTTYSCPLFLYSTLTTTSETIATTATTTTTTTSNATNATAAAGSTANATTGGVNSDSADISSSSADSSSSVYELSVSDPFTELAPNGATILLSDPSMWLFQTCVCLRLPNGSAAAAQPPTLVADGSGSMVAMCTAATAAIADVLSYKETSSSSGEGNGSSGKGTVTLSVGSLAGIIVGVSVGAFTFAAVMLLVLCCVRHAYRIRRAHHHSYTNRRRRVAVRGGAPSRRAAEAAEAYGNGGKSWLGRLWQLCVTVLDGTDMAGLVFEDRSTYGGGGGSKSYGNAGGGGGGGLRLSEDAASQSSALPRRQMPGSQFEAKRSRPPGAHPEMFGQEVCLVATDVEGSTELWEWHPGVMNTALALHDRLVRLTMAACCGYEVTTEGDAFLVAFHDPVDAVRWALLLQSSLLKLDWPPLLLEHPLCRPRPLVPVACVTAASSAPGIHHLQSHNPHHPHAPTHATAQHQQHSGNGPMGQAHHDTLASPLLVLFKGLSVRMGIATGVPSAVREHPVTRRMQYTGAVLRLATGIAELGSGGQVLLEPLTFKGIHNKFEELDVEESEVQELVDLVRAQFSEEEFATATPALLETPAAAAAPPLLTSTTSMTLATPPQQQQQQQPQASQQAQPQQQAPFQPLQPLPDHLPPPHRHLHQVPSLSLPQVTFHTDVVGIDGRALITPFGAEPPSAAVQLQPPNRPVSQQHKRDVRRGAWSNAKPSRRENSFSTASTFLLEHTTASSMHPTSHAVAGMAPGASSGQLPVAAMTRHGAVSTAAPPPPLQPALSLPPPPQQHHQRRPSPPHAHRTGLGGGSASTEPPSEASTGAAATSNLPLTSSIASVPSSGMYGIPPLQMGNPGGGIAATELTGHQQQSPPLELGGPRSSTPSAPSLTFGGGGGGGGGAPAVGGSVGGMMPLGPAAAVAGHTGQSCGGVSLHGSMLRFNAGASYHPMVGTRHVASSFGGGYRPSLSSLDLLLTSSLGAAATALSPGPVHTPARNTHPRGSNTTSAWPQASANTATASASATGNPNHLQPTTSGRCTTATTTAGGEFSLHGGIGIGGGGGGGCSSHQHHRGQYHRHQQHHPAFYFRRALTGANLGMNLEINWEPTPTVTFMPTEARRYVQPSIDGQHANTAPTIIDTVMPDTALPEPRLDFSSGPLPPAASVCTAANAPSASGASVFTAMATGTPATVTTAGDIACFVAAEKGAEERTASAGEDAPLGMASTGLIQDGHGQLNPQQPALHQQLRRDQQQGQEQEQQPQYPAADGGMYWGSMESDCPSFGSVLRRHGIRVSSSTTASTAGPVAEGMEHDEVPAGRSGTTSSPRQPGGGRRDSRLYERLSDEAIAAAAAASGGGLYCGDRSRQLALGTSPPGVSIASLGAATGFGPVEEPAAAECSGNQGGRPIAQESPIKIRHPIPASVPASGRNAGSGVAGRLPSNALQQSLLDLGKRTPSGGLTFTPGGTAAAVGGGVDRSMRSSSSLAAPLQPLHRLASVSSARDDGTSDSYSGGAAAAVALSLAPTLTNATGLPSYPISSRQRAFAWPSSWEAQLPGASAAVDPGRVRFSEGPRPPSLINPGVGGGWDVNSDESADNGGGGGGGGQTQQQQQHSNSGNHTQNGSDTPQLAASPFDAVIAEMCDATAGGGDIGGGSDAADPNLPQPSLSLPYSLPSLALGSDMTLQLQPAAAPGNPVAVADVAAAAELTLCGCSGAAADADAAGGGGNWRAVSTAAGRNRTAENCLLGGGGEEGGMPPPPETSGDVHENPSSSLDSLANMVGLLGGPSGMPAEQHVADIWRRSDPNVAGTQRDEQGLVQSMSRMLVIGSPSTRMETDMTRGSNANAVMVVQAPRLLALRSTMGIQATGSTANRAAKEALDLSMAHGSDDKDDDASSGESTPRGGVGMSSGPSPVLLPSTTHGSLSRMQSPRRALHSGTRGGGGLLHDLLQRMPSTSIRQGIELMARSRRMLLPYSEDGDRDEGRSGGGSGAPGSTAGRVVAMSSGGTRRLGSDALAAAASSNGGGASDASPALLSGANAVSATVGTAGGAEVSIVVGAIGDAPTDAYRVDMAAEQFRSKGRNSKRAFIKSLSARRAAARVPLVVVGGELPSRTSSRLRLRGSPTRILANTGGSGTAAGAAAVGTSSAAAAAVSAAAASGSRSSASHSLVVVDMGVHRLKISALGAAYGDLYDGVQVIQILPAHLKHRAAYHPPLKSQAQIAPGFFDAPGAAQALLPCAPGEAPSFPRLSLMFIQPAGYSAVANRNFAVAERSGAIFCAAVREVLQVLGVYECQEYECTFMVACRDPRVAAETALALHEWLLQADWPTDLLEEHPEGRVQLSEDGRPLLRGFRAKVGIFTGVPLTVVPHATTGRADYFGALVNRAARLMAGAKAGQTLIDKTSGIEVLKEWRQMAWNHTTAATAAGVPASSWNSPALHDDAVHLRAADRPRRASYASGTSSPARPTGRSVGPRVPVHPVRGPSSTTTTGGGANVTITGASIPAAAGTAAAGAAPLQPPPMSPTVSPPPEGVQTHIQAANLSTGSNFEHQQQQSLLQLRPAASQPVECLLLPLQHQPGAPAPRAPAALTSATPAAAAAEAAPTGAPSAAAPAVAAATASPTMLTTQASTCTAASSSAAATPLHGPMLLTPATTTVTEDEAGGPLMHGRAHAEALVSRLSPANCPKLSHAHALATVTSSPGPSSPPLPSQQQPHQHQQPPQQLVQLLLQQQQQQQQLLAARQLTGAAGFMAGSFSVGPSGGAGIMAGTTATVPAVQQASPVPAPDW